MINAFLVGPRLYLRPPEVEDAPRLCGWLNDPPCAATSRATRP